jgi:general stress protein YciG
MSSANTNPGNFANRSKEEVSDIGRKGGQSNSGGVGSNNSNKEVYSMMRSNS